MKQFLIFVVYQFTIAGFAWAVGKYIFGVIK